MALKQTPQIAGEDIVAIYPGTTTNTPPKTNENMFQIKDTINKMFQFFPDREKIAYKVLDSTTERSLQGSRGSIDGSISAYFTTDLRTAHLKMLEWQIAPAGCFWLKWYIKSEDRTVAIRLTVDDMIKTPEEESGSLSLKELTVSNVGDAIESQGNTIGEPILGTITVTSVAGTDAGETLIVVNPLPPLNMIALYNTGADLVVPKYDDVITIGGGESDYKAFINGVEITATNSEKINIVYIDNTTDRKVKSAGQTTIVSKSTI